MSSEIFRLGGMSSGRTAGTGVFVTSSGLSDAGRISASLSAAAEQNKKDSRGEEMINKREERGKEEGVEG